MARRRRKLQQTRQIRRFLILLGVGLVVLLTIAVVGRLLTPVETADGPFSGYEFGACNVCVEHLQKSEGGLPEGAELPNCLLDVGASYRGDGVYDVHSFYSVREESGETRIQAYRCRAQIGEYGVWQILDFQLEH